MMDNKAEPNAIDRALFMFRIWVYVNCDFKVVGFVIYCWGSW